MKIFVPPVNMSVASQLHGDIPGPLDGTVACCAGPANRFPLQYLDSPG